MQLQCSAACALVARAHYSCQKVHACGLGLQGAQKELEEAGYQGLILGGNYVAGVALGKCVEYAYTYAGLLASYLKSNTPAVTSAVGPNSQQEDDAASTFNLD